MYALAPLLLLVVLGILLIHITEGVENVIQDHVHHAKTKALCNLPMKRVQIECLRCVYIFIFFQGEQKTDFLRQTLPLQAKNRCVLEIQRL